MAKYLTKKQVAGRFSVSINTVGRWVRAGKFPAPLKIGSGKQSICRWPADQVEAWEAGQAPLQTSENTAALCSAIANAARLRETSAAEVDTRAGKKSVEISPDAADEMIAAYLDRRAEEARRAVEKGGRLTKHDRDLIDYLFKNAPASFFGLRTHIGKCYLLPSSSAYTHCDSPPVWLELPAGEALNQDFVRVVDERPLGSGLTSFRVEFVRSPFSDPEYFQNLRQMFVAEGSNDE